MLDATLHRPAPFSATPIRVAVVASLLLHAALIIELPSWRTPLLDPPGPLVRDSPLMVHLAPPFEEPPARVVSPPSPPVPRPPAHRAPPRASPPPVMAMEQPAPTPAPAPPVAPPARAISSGDLLAYVDARRFARDLPSDPRDAPDARAAEDERTRANRLAQANLSSQRQITFGYDPSRSGGVFTVVHQTLDYAEFTFVGWNADMGRRTKQLIEVRKGDAPTIQVAVVRKMIAIIRTYEPVEFTWDSRRLGRSVTLSSRLRDNAGLEDFMLREFF